MAGVSSVGGIVIPVMVIRGGDKAALIRLKAELMGVANTVREVNTSMAAQTVASGKATKGVKGFLKGMTNVRWALVNVALVAMTLKGIFNVLLKGAIELESGMANVRKTTGLNADQIDQLRREFIELSTILPIAAKDLAEIGVVAGQLGLGKDNVEEIRNFVSVVAMMSTATGMAAEDAARDLAKISQAFGMPIANAVNLASVINELENTSAATSQEISESMKRVGVSASQLGMSTEFVAALETTLISAGMKSSRAGTRMRSAINTIAADVGKFASLTNQTFDNFQEKLETNAEGALLDVVKAFIEMGVSSQKTATAVEYFGKIGGFAIATLAGDYDELERHVKTARDEMESGNSIIAETAAQLETTAMQWDMLTNSVKSHFLSTEGWVNKLLTQARNMGDIKRDIGVGNIRQFFSGAKETGRQEAQLYKVRAEELTDAMAEAGYSVKKQQDIFNRVFDAKDMRAVFDLLSLELEVAQGVSAANDELSDSQVNLGAKYSSGQDAVEDYAAKLAASNDIFGKSYEEVQALSWALADVEEKLTNSFTPEEIQIIKDMANSMNELKTATESVAEASKKMALVQGMVNKRLAADIANASDEYNSYKNYILAGEQAQLDNIFALEQAINKERLAQLRLEQATAKTNDTLNGQQDSYDAWVQTVHEFIKQTVSSGQSLGSNVTSAVKQYQTLLLGTSKFEGGADGSGESEALADLQNQREIAQLEYGLQYDQQRRDVDSYIEKLEGRTAKEFESSTAAILALSAIKGEVDRLVEKQEDIAAGWAEDQLAADLMAAGFENVKDLMAKDIDSLITLAGTLKDDFDAATTAFNNLKDAQTGYAFDDVDNQTSESAKIKMVKLPNGIYAEPSAAEQWFKDNPQDTQVTKPEDGGYEQYQETTAVGKAFSIVGSKEMRDFNLMLATGGKSILLQDYVANKNGESDSMSQDVNANITINRTVYDDDDTFARKVGKVLGELIRNPMGVNLGNGPSQIV